MNIRKAVKRRMLTFVGLLLLAALVWFVTPAVPLAVDGRLQIEGRPPFTQQVREALQILKTKDKEAYEIVTHYVGRIQEGKRSGMWADQNPPTYVMSDLTAFHSVTWCAATIAHDSFHSKLYHDYRETHYWTKLVPRKIWTGVGAEQTCMKHQIAVMKRIGAPELELDHAKAMADGNYVKDNDGWTDYLKRNW